MLITDNEKTEMRNDVASFLEKSIQTIIQENKNDYSEYCLIFPTKRSVLYAKHHFLNHISESTFLPDFFTFEEFIRQYNNLMIISQEDCLIYLHIVYTDIRHKYNFSFSDFLSYSIMLLKDFDTMDQNMASEKNMFESLSARSSLDRWAEDLGNIEDFTFDENGIAGGYFTFWEICRDIYSGLKKVLLSKSLAYSGLAYRNFAENFEQIQKSWNYQKFEFFGFNYLTESQKQIIKSISNTSSLKMHWDIDSYFYERSYHEAGKYFREYKSLQSGSFLEHNISLDSFPEVRVYSCPNKNAQIKFAVDQVLEILKGLDFEKDIRPRKDLIAFIPADEQLLKIILESFPSKFKDKNDQEYETADIINISMGRSIRESIFFQLFHIIFELQETLENPERRITYKLVKSLLNHPLVKSCFKNDVLIDRFENNCRKNNISFPALEDVLLIEDNQLLPLLFRSWGKNGKGLSAYSIELINAILTTSKEIEKDEKVFLKTYIEVFEKLKPLITQFAGDLDFKTFKNLVFQIISQNSVPFAGQPVSAIQIIGLLETRALDFDYVFVLSCNEGSLPKKRSQDSLIPFEIRKLFSMPTFIDKDASLSYTFYRLFYRSQQVNLYYHNAIEAMSGKASPSRYIKQLNLELLPDFNRNIHSDVLKHHFPKNQDKEFSIYKDKFIIDTLEEYVRGKQLENAVIGLSPSRINTYLSSPITFFQRTVLKIKEAETLEVGFAPSTFGSIIHEVLEDIFNSLIGQEVNENVIKKIKSEIDLQNLLNEKTKKLAGSIAIESGLNKLYLYSAKVLIEKYFNVLSKNDDFFVLAVEEELHHSFEFYHETLGKSIKVTIVGLADRIDFVNDKIRILDYKTGNLDSTTFNFDDLDNLWVDDKRDKIIQLLIYKYLLIKSSNELPFMRGMENKEIESGFYFFKKSQNPFLKLNHPDELNNNEDFCRIVESILTKTVSHMIDPNIPFEEVLEESIWN